MTALHSAHTCDIVKDYLANYLHVLLSYRNAILFTTVRENTHELLRHLVHLKHRVTLQADRKCALEWV